MVSRYMAAVDHAVENTPATRYVENRKTVSPFVGQQHLRLAD
jgi:hypothetical protein